MYCGSRVCRGSEVEAIADGSGLLAFSVVCEATLFHDSNGSQNGRVGVGDEGAHALVSLEVRNEGLGGFSGEAPAFIRRQDAVADLADGGWVGFRESSYRADEGSSAVRLKESYVARPTDLIWMLVELVEEEVEDVRLPIYVGPGRGDGAADDFA